MKSMLSLRPVEKEDIARISEWPAYPPDFHELDYALRADGWLAEFRSRLGARCYVAQENGEAIGFSILSRESQGAAEFRIALRLDKIGHGYGARISLETLAKGFADMRLSTIHLIVRKNNPRAIQLYRKLGFLETGECVREIQGKCVEFISMVIDRHTWLTQHGEKH
jgi:diamine N-acetyltransferase